MIQLKHSKNNGSNAMPSSHFLLSCLTLLAIFGTNNAAIIRAEYEIIRQDCHNDKGNYTSNSTYEANLDRLLSVIVSNRTLEPGLIFFNSTYGVAPDAVYSIAQCRGDVGTDICRGCLQRAREDIREVCRNTKQATLWYNYCLLRYSDNSILGIQDNGVMTWRSIGDDVAESSSAVFSRQFWALMYEIRNRAMNGDSLRKFATGNASVSDSLTIHGLAQCTPDLSLQDCYSCLSTLIKLFEENGINRKTAAQIIAASCYIRFGIEPFYEYTADEVQSISLPQQPPMLSPPSLSPSPSSNVANGKGRDPSRRMITIVVPSVLSVVALLICICLYWRRARTRTRTRTKTVLEKEELNEEESLQFDFSTIRKATDDFSDENMLGRGGFGTVYRGRLSNGREIAVKRMIKNHDTKQQDLEFKNEVSLVAKLGHRNLVSLLGFAIEERERILVYEYMPNSSLDHYIFDPMKRAEFGWKNRYKIIIGITRGLLYLHEDSRLKIIHRDLKAGNILLDADLNPKISDFGTARLFVIDQSRAETRYVAGTYGYIAPEYAQRGEFSVKSDVFSFGVLILEIICGQPVKDFHDGEKMERLLTYAWENWNKGSAMKLADPKMREHSQDEIIRCVHIGLLCVQENKEHRPTMGEVVVMLNSYSMSLPRPSRPAYFVQMNDQPSQATNTNKLENSSSMISENVVSITELYPR